MAIRTILVSLTTPDAARRLMGPACALARRQNAHLIGLHTIEALGVYPGVAVHFSTGDLSAFQQRQEQQATEINAIFEEATRTEDFVSEWRLVNAGSLTAADRIVEHARGADLVVMSQENPAEDRPDQHHIQNRTIRESGRPVLVIPYAGSFEQIGAKAMVGWTPTREATRAAHDAIGVMASGAEALIITVHQGPEADALARDTAEQVALCYDRHGIRATVVDHVGSGVTVGDTLLNQAYENHCDLLVTGAFGHSAAYDLLFGGATGHLLKRMTLPVLFST